MKEDSLSLQEAFQGVQSSYKTLLHAAQWVKSGEFAQYNYGAEGNKKKYGSEKTPRYFLNRTTVPVLIFRADSDMLTSSEVSFEETWDAFRKPR